MTLLIAGKDRTADLEPVLRAEADARRKDPRCAFLAPSMNALSLADAASEADYLRCLLFLVRHKNHVDTLFPEMPRKPGAMGAAMGLVRRFLWKLLRYQHDRIAFRQNLVNTHLLHALEFSCDEHRKLADRVHELEQRLRALESARGGGAR